MAGGSRAARHREGRATFSEGEQQHCESELLFSAKLLPTATQRAESPSEFGAGEKTTQRSFHENTSVISLTSNERYKSN